jgi:hypothetical protein
VTYKNVYGEESPDSMTVTLWVDANGQLQQAQCGNSTVKPAELNLGNEVATIIGGFQYASSVQLAKPSIMNVEQYMSLVRVKHSFTLIDCGRWGGKTPLAPLQRNFAIVWGTYAVLCDYLPADAALDTDANLLCDEATKKPYENHPINALLRHLRGNGHSVKVHKWVRTENRNFGDKWDPDWSVVYVVVPDLHLPISIAKPAALPNQPSPKYAVRHPADTGWHTHDALVATDGPSLARFQYQDETRCAGTKPGEGEQQLKADGEGMVTWPNGARALGVGADSWFDRLRAGDIFGAPGVSAAADDLTAFLDRILTAKFTGFGIHFIQVGDMYDYWIGLQCFFKDTPPGSAPVTLQDGWGMKATDFLDAWGRRTEACFPAMFAKFRALDAAPNLTTSYLWGNHDNYMGAYTPKKPDGAPLCKTRIKEIRGTPTGQKPAGKKNVYIEHGQRVDPYNRDGRVEGHKMTNDVFTKPVLRTFDPNRRNYFATGAAIAYAADPNFAIYVMGHTHSPFLTQVTIDAKLWGR